jgi:hypothetical protein
MASLICYDSTDEFWEDRFADRVPVGVPVYLMNEPREAYGITMDGTGYFWYDTIQELLAEH